MQGINNLVEKFESSNLCKFYENHSPLLKCEGTYLMKYIPKVKNRQKVRIYKNREETIPILKSIEKIKNLINSLKPNNSNSSPNEKFLEIKNIIKGIDKKMDSLLEKAKSEFKKKNPHLKELQVSKIFSLGTKALYKKNPMKKCSDYFEKLDEKILIYSNIDKIIKKGSLGLKNNITNKIKELFQKLTKINCKVTKKDKERIFHKIFLITSGILVVTISLIALAILTPFCVAALLTPALVAFPLFLLMGMSGIGILIMLLIGMGLIYFGAKL